jgi:hypothetical protein
MEDQMVVNGELCDIKKKLRNEKIESKVTDTTITSQQDSKLAEKSILDNLSFIPAWLLTRTDNCRHNHACLENILRGFFKTFKNGMIIKLVVSNIASIGSPARLLKNL